MTVTTKEEPVTVTTKAGKRLLDIIYGMDPDGLYPHPADLVAAVELEARTYAKAEVTVAIANEWIDAANRLLNEVDNEGANR